MSASRLLYPRKQTLFRGCCTSAMGQEETHAPPQNRSRFELLHRSGVQLVEQRLGLLQIERVESLGEPAVDWREQSACFGAPALFAP